MPALRGGDGFGFVGTGAPGARVFQLPVGCLPGGALGFADGDAVGVTVVAADAGKAAVRVERADVDVGVLLFEPDALFAAGVAALAERLVA